MKAVQVWAVFYCNFGGKNERISIGNLELFLLAAKPGD